MLTLECANKTLCQNYTVIYRRLHRYGTALTEEQLGQHEILRAPHVCGRALRMTSFFRAGGFAPCTPIREREHRCLAIIVQFDILFFHIQVCQQYETGSLARAGFLIFPLDKYPLGVYNIVYKIMRGIKMDKNCCCTHKTKERGDEEYRSLINRLNRIEGQIRGIRNMVENSAYCTDILVQVQAASAALNSFSKELLSNHIKTCVADDIRAGKDETVDELVVTLQKLMR